MSCSQNETIGLIPAAGRATRLGKLPCSKELLPVSLAGRYRANDSHGFEAAIDASLAVMAHAKISRAFVVIAPDKWDIPAYLGDGSRHSISLAYLVAEASPNVPYSLDRAYSFVCQQNVLLLFPDIFFRPREAVAQIIRNRCETTADVVLALVPSADGHKVDLVSLSDDGKVTSIAPKPGAGIDGWTWVAATWTPGFTEFLHQQVANESAVEKHAEFYVGDVFIAAIDAGLCVRGVCFADGRAIDIGTPAELLEFWRSGL